MADLDKLLKQASTLKKPLDLLKRFKESPRVVEYVRKTMEERDKVLATAQKYDRQMRKIAALLEGDDQRFHGDFELRNSNEQYAALASTVSRIPAGESWYANLSNEAFFPVLDVPDWWSLTVAKMLWQLREHFDPVHGAALSMEHYAKMSLARIDDIEYRFAAPIIKIRRGFEPQEAPRRSNLDE
jgi:hypothetical protein